CPPKFYGAERRRVFPGHILYSRFSNSVVHAVSCRRDLHTGAVEETSESELRSTFCLGDAKVLSGDQTKRSRPIVRSQYEAHFLHNNLCGFRLTHHVCEPRALPVLVRGDAGMLAEGAAEIIGA